MNVRPINKLEEIQEYKLVHFPGGGERIKKEEKKKKEKKVIFCFALCQTGSKLLLALVSQQDIKAFSLIQNGTGCI